MGEFRLPSLGADMEEGTIVEWLVAEGDEVHRGDIVAVVDTDKADIDVEVFESGVVGEILVPAGERVPVGTPLAMIVSAASSAVAPDRQPTPTAVAATLTSPPAVISPGAAAPVAVPAATVPAATVPAGAVDHLHSPVLRRLAAHLGVDTDTIQGSGPGGSITRDDIERAARTLAPPTGPLASSPPVAPPGPVTSGAPAEPAPGRSRSDSRRQAIAGLMTRSKREIPHYYVATQIDMTPALTWLREHNSGRPPSERALPAALLLRAVALSLLEVPQLNGFWIDDQFVPGAGIHLGVAVSLRDGGLVAPAIRDIDRLDVDGVMSALRDLVQRARSGRLRSSEMADPTCTVTNLGDQGVDTVYPVIYPPQVAMVGLGSITERPWATNGMLGVRHVVTATLAADHRATDGHLGARLLSQLNERLQDVEAL